MRSFGIMAGLALATIPVFGWTQAPFEFSGLNTQQVFNDAVAKAEQLGGDCQVSRSRAKEGGVNAQCDFLPCVVGTQAGVCEEPDPAYAGLMIAAQPILRIGLAAPGNESRLTKIVILFDGSMGPVEESLKQTFGSPDKNGTSSGEKSWSHSRRLSWTQGNYRMGLLSHPNMLILAVNRTQQVPNTNVGGANPATDSPAP